MSTVLPFKRVVRIDAGQSPPSSEVADLSQGLPFLQGNAEFGSTSPIPLYECSSAPKRVLPGDVLLSVRAPVGALNIADRSYGIGRGLAGIRARDADSRFIWWWLHSQRPALDAMSNGTTYRAVTAEDVGELPFPQINVDEQCRIADFLDAETARIDRLSGAISKSSNLLQVKRRALLRSIFSDDGCASVRLGYYLDLVTSGPRGWGEYVGLQGTPFFRSANLRREGIEPNLDALTLVEPPPSASAEALRSRVRMSDVLIGITGANTGWVSFADQRIANANVSQHVCLVRPSKMVEGRWLAYALSAPQVQELLLGSQYGGTKTQLSLGDIRDLVLPLPPNSDQRRIAANIGDGLTAIAAEQAARDRQLILLEERRQALITAAVTGQIDVKTARGLFSSGGVAV
jgi:type I restriction enzyme, S subunit